MIGRRMEAQLYLTGPFAFRDEYFRHYEKNERWDQYVIIDNFINLCDCADYRNSARSEHSWGI